MRRYKIYWRGLKMNIRSKIRFCEIRFRKTSEAIYQLKLPSDHSQVDLPSPHVVRENYQVQACSYSIVDSLSCRRGFVFSLSFGLEIKSYLKHVDMYASRYASACILTSVWSVLVQNNSLALAYSSKETDKPRQKVRPPGTS